MRFIRFNILLLSLSLFSFSTGFAKAGTEHELPVQAKKQAAAGREVLRNGTVMPAAIAGSVRGWMSSNHSVLAEEEEAAAASDKSVKDSIAALFRNIATSGNWIDNITDNSSIAYPFGMHKVIGGTTYEIAFAGIGFNKTGAVARVFARCILPQRTGTDNAKTLYFAGFVSLARSGGVISDGKLNLVGNETVSGGDQWSLILNGSSSSGSTGSSASSTYFTFDCGGFTELGINGTIQLDARYIPVDSKTFKRAASGSVISAPVVVSLSKWDDFYAENLKFTGTFMLKDIPGYAFSITAATLDFTDAKNPSGDAIKSYVQKVQSVLPNTWRGLSITGINVYLPKYFTTGQDAENPLISGTFAVIDDNGFSVKGSGSNLLDIKKGSANGWPISISKFNLEVSNSAISSGSFSGKLVLPVEDKASEKSGIAYDATLNSDGTFDVRHGEINAIKADMWKGYLVIDPSFELSLTLKDNKLFPKVNLSGKFSFHFNGNKLDPVRTPDEAKKTKFSFGIEDASFEELVLQTEKPFMAVKSLGTASQLEIGGFSADVSVEYQDKKPVSYDANAEYSCLHFDANVQLMEGKIGGGTAFDIYCKYDTAKRTWTYDSYKLTQVKINAEFGKVSFKGSLDIMNDSIYGKGFNGIVQLKVSTIEIKAGAMFGTKYNSDGSSFKYWNVDAFVKGLNIKLFNIIEIQGFSGGATYRMDPIAPDGEHPITASGISYVPNENSFLRVRAGVFLSLVNKTVVSGWGGIEIVFNKNWGVDEFSISGNAQFFSKGVDEKSEKNKITPLTKGNKQTKASRLADAAAKAPAVKTPKTPKPVQTVKVAPKVTSVPAVDKSGKAITTKKGKPLVSKTTEKTMANVLKDKSGKPLLDKNGKPLEATTATKTTSKVAMGKSGKPLLDASGDPIMINATTKTVTTPVLDAQGKQVVDEKGNPTYDVKKELITPKVLVDANGKPVLDKKGNPIIKYKIKNLAKKKGKEGEKEEEEKGGGDDKIELAENKEDSDEEDKAAEEESADTGDKIADDASQFLMNADNPDLTDVSQQLLVAKNELNIAEAELKKAQADQQGPDERVNWIRRALQYNQSSGDGNSINVPVQDHNWFRNGPDWSSTWPIVCSILNIPYIPDNLQIKTGNYSIPTQAAVTRAADSVLASYRAALLVLTPIRKKRTNLEQSQLYKDCMACAEYWYTYRSRCGISTEVKDSTKNKLAIKEWRRKADSIKAVHKALDADVERVDDSVSLIDNIYYDLKKSNLLDNARREVNYYNIIFGRKKLLEDSLNRYYTNVAAPLDSIAAIKNAVYNEKLNSYNPILTKFNNLVTIGEAARVGELAKGIRVKVQNDVALTAAEKALLKSSDSLNALATQLQDNLNRQAVAESSAKLSQDAAVKSAMSKALDNANTKLAQLKSSSNSKEYQDALQAQKAAQANLEAFVTQLRQDSTQFRQDSATISDNILANNGGLVLTATPQQLSYINKKYLPVAAKEMPKTALSSAMDLLNTPEAGSLKIYANQANAVPKMVPDGYGGRYLRYPSDAEKAAVQADAATVAKAKELMDEADNAYLDSLDKAQSGGKEPKSSAVMPVGARPDGDPPFWGNFLAKVDLANEALSFNMDVYASLEAGSTTLFEGAHENSRAGSGEVYYSKGAWHIYLGTQEDPMSMKLNMGPISGTASTYFQATNALQSDGSDIMVKHGLDVHVQFNWSGGIAFANIGGGVKYDILIKHKDNFICSSTSLPAGIYGWYGKGKVKAFLEANAGVTVFGHDFTVLSAGIYADLEVRAPNPVYFKGNLTVKYSVSFGPWSKDGSFDVSMEKGTYCDFN